MSIYCGQIGIILLSFLNFVNEKQVFRMDGFMVEEGKGVEIQR